MRTSLFVMATGLALLAWPAWAAEQVDIQAGDTNLKATLYRPSGPGPFPAVVALHACDGLNWTDGTIELRYAEWGERLAAAGYAVLFPDSFGSRGLKSQCSVRERLVRASRLRTADAAAARQWLQGQTWVVADRVSLLGWSHGASTALWTIRRTGSHRDKTPDFRSAIAFYPNCQRSGLLAWSARVPTLILIGSQDDWTPASQCEQMVAGAKGRSAAATLVVYPNALHDFDRKNLPRQERTGIASTPSPAGRVHIGTDEEAREDAFKRVAEWLAR
ncbi:MAG: dienelactone hydrolase family protein [Pseudolabrys sp.]|nr:dienelactone hydrolase family protein [Pseudolabrys sp.]MBV9260383.1 dienelactone hydrolase family protein [Pseudolabrys sp.]